MCLQEACDALRIGNQHALSNKFENNFSLNSKLKIFTCYMYYLFIFLLAILSVAKNCKQEKQEFKRHGC